jgi:hypothetical protein
VLDLAKIESGAAEWRIDTVDLGALVHDAAVGPPSCSPARALAST